MITKNMTVSDVIMRYPGTVPVFKRYGLDCCECQIAELETIEDGAKVHKVRIDELLDSLNGALNHSGCVTGKRSDE